MASTYFTIVDDETLYSSEQRRDMLSLYDETKGFADNFGHLVMAYYPDQKFRDYRLSLLVGWLVYATTNAYILYDSLIGDTGHRDFQNQVATHLMDS